ncbi:hypothetical protein CR513_49625, partial [Mucuna pruriens]
IEEVTQFICKPLRKSRRWKKIVKKHDKGKGPLKINKASVEHKRVIIATYMGNLDISKRIVQGIRLCSKRKSNAGISYIPNHKFVFMGNRVKAPIEAVETYHLILDTRRHLDLLETLYVPSVFENLVSLSKLDITTYYNIILSKYNHLIGTGILCDEYKQNTYTRSIQRFKIVHTNICGPFDVNSFRKERCFITLVDYYSCYGYVYLLHEKSQAVDALKIYLNEVEIQLDIKVKVVKSDRGG